MSIDRGMVKDVVCIYTVEYNSAIKKNGGKKNEIMPFAATWTDPEVIILSESRKRKTDSTCITYMFESFKTIQTDLFPKQKQNQRHRKQTTVTKGEGRKLGLWD